MNINLLKTASYLKHEDVLQAQLDELVSKARFLVIGAAGSIGQAVTKEIFQRFPKTLHCVDISENNLVELVRDIRSSFGYIEGNFKTFAVDCGSLEFEAIMKSHGPYDYVLNLSALKHVRSEKDPFTLMRMLDVNIFNTLKTIQFARQCGAKKYFCVSTDKATNPVNLMGASKRIMELFLMRESLSQTVSLARFANVAYSDGSLLHGFRKRFEKRQPIVAPNDVCRYFISEKQSGELCLLSCLMGENRDIFFPKLNADLHLTKFSDIAIEFLNEQGFTHYECSNETEARSRVDELISKNQWPCLFTKSDTTGEKDFEEFYTTNENLDLEKFQEIGIIRNLAIYDEAALDSFYSDIQLFRDRGLWDKREIIQAVFKILPDFSHKETSKYLDEKM